MKNSSKTSIVAGIALFVLAAVFSVSLLMVLLDFGRVNPGAEAFLFRLGKMLTGVYGLCSVLIPVFLIIAASQCFTEFWGIKRGVLLLGSVFPFFTLDALEHVCRIIIANNTDSVLGIKLSTALLIGFVIVAIEYALLTMLGDTLQNMLNKSSDDETDDDIDEEIDEDDEIVVQRPLVREQAAERVPAQVVPVQNSYADEDIQLNEGEYIESEEIYEEYADDASGDSASESVGLSTSEPANTLGSEENEIAEEPVAADEADAEAVADDEADDADLADDTVSQEKDISKLDSGEDNPFLHVFTNNAAEDAISIEEPVDFAEPEESDKSVESVSPVESEESADENPVHEVEKIEEPYIPPMRPVPQYNENAFFPEPEEDASELLELDTFNPEEDSYRGMVLPPEETPEEVEPIDEEYEEVSDIADDLDEAEADTSFNTDEFEEEAVDEDSLFSDEPVFEEDTMLDDMELMTQTEEAHRLADEMELEAEAEAENNGLFEQPEGYGEDVLEEAASEEELTEDESVAEEPVEETTQGGGIVAEEQSALDAIFAEMDDDAAESPVFDDEDEIAVPVPADPASENVDPLAPPVVNSDGVPFETAVPINFEDISLEEMENTSTVPVVQVEDDFDENDEDVVKLEKPEPLVEEPKIEKKKLRGPYRVPSDLLDTYANGEYWVIDQETKQAASDLKETLSEFKIEAEVTGIRKGPVVTMFEILPAPGVKLSKIVALQDNIALRLAASSVRIVAPIPGKHAVGIEVPNKERAVVGFKEIVDLDLPQFSKMAIPVILGKDISGEPQVLDLAKTPHLLIAGSTGAGKSVCVNSMILSILYKRSPQDVKLIMIDPKVVELKLYNDIPHLLTPVITESKRAFQSLQYCLCEMERRYACLDGMGVRDISSYNKRIVERNIAAEKLPYIVVIIDEFADLMATTGKELESTIARLAAMSRAVGIHLVLATQRPSIDVITGLIKANIPSRIAFMVASKMDSRIIIDQVGAEKLLGKGDMLYASATNPFPVRIQGTLVNDNEVEAVVDYVKQYGEPEYIDDEIFVDDEDEGGTGPGLFSDGEDPLYDEALQIVVQAGKASASYIQRRLKIGYNRAARLVEEMEERGIVGPANGSKPREVIHVPS